MRRAGSWFALALCTFAAASFAGASTSGLRITYPANGTIFPPEIVAPTVLWQDAADAQAAWSVAARDDDGRVLARARTTQTRWRPSPDQWTAIKQASIERAVTLEVAREDGGSSAHIGLRTSTDPVGDSLFYREVPLPFLEAVRDPSRIRWRFGTIDMEAGPPVVLEDLPVCGNCHSFSGDGSVLGLDVDYGNDKGGYGILPVSSHMVLDDESIITWADYEKDDGEVTFGLLSQVSPDGRWVVSTVKDRSVFVAIDDLMISQLFFPIKGILVVYDRETGRFFSLPGADDPDFVQTNPEWSPDGKEIVFARAPAHRSERMEQQNAALLDLSDVPEFTVDNKPFRYDLYRIPFNQGEGGIATPIEGASDNGQSNYFAKYSPDGKWIVFTRSDNYMLLRPDSELYIVPTSGGPARRLRHNTERMNSWHSWSSNSRWIVFSSKANGPYTQLFLTHIDEEGNDSPPVLLERFTDPDRAANIPEFVPLPGDAITEIRERFLDPYSFLRAGTANQRTGDHAGAERAFRRGLELAPDDAELRNALGWTLFQAGRPAEAVEEYDRALRNDPGLAKSHNNMALALLELGRREEAAGHFRTSLALEPRAEIHSDLGVTLAGLGRHREAMEEFGKAIALDPDSASAHQNLAVFALERGDYSTAETHYRAALRTQASAPSYNGLGFALSERGETGAAIRAFESALELDPAFVPAYNNLAGTLAREGRLQEAADLYRQSLERRPTPATHYALSGVLRIMGQSEEANAEIERARALAAAN